MKQNVIWKHQHKPNLIQIMDIYASFLIKRDIRIYIFVYNWVIVIQNTNLFTAPVEIKSMIINHCEKGTSTTDENVVDKVENKDTVDQHNLAGKKFNNVCVKCLFP